MEAKWKDRTAFAEVAEALGVDTDQVMAVGPGGLVLYTPVQGSTDIWRAVVRRDAHGVPVASRRERLPGMWEEITAYVDERMR